MPAEAKASQRMRAPNPDNPRSVADKPKTKPKTQKPNPKPKNQTLSPHQRPPLHLKLSNQPLKRILSIPRQGQKPKPKRVTLRPVRQIDGPIRHQLKIQPQRPERPKDDFRIQQLHPMLERRHTLVTRPHRHAAKRKILHFEAKPLTIRQAPT